MKKFLAILLAAMMVFALAACAQKSADKPADAADYKVAMITDYGDITDQSFNQTTYEACKEYCEDNKIDFKYYKPANNSTSDRVAMVDSAVADGYNVIVLPGYAFAGTVQEAAPEYPDVKFIVLDVAKGDYLEAGVGAAGEAYDYNPDNWELSKYIDLSNVYTVIYQEELCGYMAGYAAVKLGYTKLGFLGGMAVPAVIRYGQGYVQGIDDAAKDMGINVSVKYVYGGQFAGDADITAVMDTWYSGGTEVVFSCGGGIYTSACEAAAKVGGKVIGVDTDQAGILNAYGADMTVTSAMKGLAPTTKDALNSIIKEDGWSKMAGQIVTLGLVSGDNPEANYVQIPMDSTQFEDGKFTKDDYKAVVAAMFKGDLKVSDDITTFPATTNASVEIFDNIK